MNGGGSARPSYGGAHKRLRAELAPVVAAGQVRCWRCRRLIRPGQKWDLGHSDWNPNKYNGPEHIKCNRGAGARKKAILARKKKLQRTKTPPKPPTQLPYTQSWW